MIASAKDLSSESGDFKSVTARKILDHLEDRKVFKLLDQFAYHKAKYKLDREHQFWEEGSHPQVIEDEDVMSAAWLEYIHQNPVKTRRTWIRSRNTGVIPAARDYAWARRGAGASHYGLDVILAGIPRLYMNGAGI